MSRTYMKMLVTVAVVITICCSACPAFKTSRLYCLTIYVDEGHGSANGHVFLSLSDGSRTAYHGFYSKSKALALASMGGGEVRDDSRLAGNGWDVKMTYLISMDGLAKAQDAIARWRKQDEAWWIDHHCGDFAETVAESAGLDVKLPWHVTGRNRPGIFGEYLRKNGGVVRSSGVLSLPEPNPPVAPSQAAGPDLNGRWICKDYVGGEEIVIIRHYGSVVSAVKTKGNKHVSAGSVTWQGNYTSNTFVGQVQYGDVDGSGVVKRRYFRDATITIKDKDHLSVTLSGGSVGNFSRMPS